MICWSCNSRESSDSGVIGDSVLFIDSDKSVDSGDSCKLGGFGNSEECGDFGESGECDDSGDFV